MGFMFQITFQGLTLTIISVYDPKYTQLYIISQPVINIAMNIVKEIMLQLKFPNNLDVILRIFILILQFVVLFGLFYVFAIAFLFFFNKLRKTSVFKENFSEGAK